MLDLTDYNRDGNIHLISPPQQFEGGEEAYDQHIGGAQRADLLRPGRGAWILVERHAGRAIEAVLEIGAGGGTCTLGLVAAAPGADILVTDTSPQFLRIVARKLGAARIDSHGVHYATLAGEDLGRLGGACFDAVVIASALHHVWDWRAFLGQAARVLRPGGVLVIQEPCREGNLMMGMALDVVLSPLWPARAALTPADRDRVLRCRDSIYYLARSGIRKDGEDKHSFLVNELVEGGDAAGFRRSVFYSNLHFQDIPDQAAAGRRGVCSLVSYLDSFLEHHHRVSLEGMARLRTHLFPIFAGLDQVFMEGDGAPLLGSTVFCR